MNVKAFKKSVEKSIVIFLAFFNWYLIQQVFENMQQQPVRAFAVNNEVVVGRLQPAKRGRPPKEPKSSLTAEQEMILTKLKSTAKTADRLTNHSRIATIDEIKNSAVEFDEDMEAILNEIQTRTTYVTQTTNEKKAELFEIEGSLHLNENHLTMISTYRKMSVEELQTELLALELHKSAINCLIFIKENDDKDMELVFKALRDMQDEMHSSRNDTSFLRAPNAPDTQEIP